MLPMKFKPIVITSRSITLELENNDIVNTKEYSIKVNGELYLKSDFNVISIFNLVPNTNYKITIEESNNSHSMDIKTLDESVSLNVKRFGAKGDGKTNDTNSIQAAILACPDNGRVYIP